MSYAEVVLNRTRGGEVYVGLLHIPPSNVTSVPFAEQCLGAEGSPAYSTLLSILAALDGSLLSAVIAANALVLLCVALSRAPPPGSPARDVGRSSRRFIANLAAADALVGAASATHLVFRYGCGARAALAGRRLLCLARFFLLADMHLTSSCAMAAVALDRYVAICHALRYRHIMNGRRSRLLLAFAWLLPVLLCSLQFTWNQYHWSSSSVCDVEVIPLSSLYMGIFSHGFLLSVVGFTHYRIHCVAASMSSGLGGSRLRLDSSAETTASLQARPGSQQSHSPSHSSNAPKSARTVLLVTGCYFVCWLPYVCILFARVMGVKGFGIDVGLGLSYTLAHVNYLVNPFIYAWKNPEVRSAIVGVCKRLIDSKSGPSTHIRTFRMNTIRLSQIS